LTVEFTKHLLLSGLMETTVSRPSKAFTRESSAHLFSNSVRRELATAFRKNRVALAEALFQGAKESDRTSWKSPEDLAHLDEWARAHFLEAINIASKWLGESSELWEDLFAGWIHSRLTAPVSDQGTANGYKPSEALEYAKAQWLSALESKVSPVALRILTQHLDRVIASLPKQTRKDLRVLFIGDCLQYEVITALLGPCARAQIRLTPVMIHERVQAALRNRIRTMGATEFDLVFFSPFTHAFLPEYSQLLRPSTAFWSRAECVRWLDRPLEDVASTIRALAQQFECPVYVHNTAGTMQTFGIGIGWAKNVVSQRNRKRAREVIHDRISRWAQEPGLEGRIRLLDENSVRDHRSDWNLAKVYFRGDLFHPTRLGVELGRRTCFEAIYSAAFLASRKVVVCDLDNTLWDGIIGEGTVTHFFDRQRILKGLRDRGVLLSISSKNDPKNVHFSGAVLQAHDFVAPRIDWLPKAGNIASIAAELNLKTKDFVFVDDRPDELERVQDTFPEILALNAQDPATWKVLSHWQEHLSVDREEDRTKLYHERVAREDFLATNPKSENVREDEAAALHRLGLSVKLEEVSRSGLKRVAELINRTNQFNLCGSRSTLRDLEDGLGGRHRIVIATAQDKFGGMGVVGVMKIDRKPHCMEIPIFVLSCRVFGFGIEYALLNYVRHLAPADHSIVGHYKETQFNQPCRDLYAKSALSWDGSKWVGKIADLPADPGWLTIESHVSAPFSAAATTQR
jgi:FkbH-like protein